MTVPYAGCPTLTKQKVSFCYFIPLTTPTPSLSRPSLFWGWRDPPSRLQSNPGTLWMGFFTSFFPFFFFFIIYSVWSQNTQVILKILLLRYRLMIFFRVTLFLNVLWFNSFMLFLLKYYKSRVLPFFLLLCVNVHIGLFTMCNNWMCVEEESVWPSRPAPPPSWSY